MSEIIAFLFGLIVMGIGIVILWFISDLQQNPYMRGYQDGLRDGINEVLNDFSKHHGADMRGEEDGLEL